MSQMTADLEYLKCDMCGTYFHKEIFCPHRRECKGKDCKEIRKAEAQLINDTIDKQERKARAERSNNPILCDPSTISGGLEAAVQRRESAIRTEIANSWAAEQDRQLAEKLDRKKIDSLMAELDDE